MFLEADKSSQQKPRSLERSVQRNVADFNSDPKVSVYERLPKSPYSDSESWKKNMCGLDDQS